MREANLTRDQLTKARRVQLSLYANLEGCFGSGIDKVHIEWDTSKDSRDGLSRDGWWPPYCPRPDLAVGPFNLSEDEIEVVEKKKKIFAFAKDSIGLLERLSQVNRQDSEYGTHPRFCELLSDIKEGVEPREGFNKNPRCFMSIEIENSADSKYLLGDVTNACALGFVGIVVPTTPKTLKKFIELRRYIEFATVAKKMPKIFNNLIIISAEELTEILRKTVVERARGVS